MEVERSKTGVAPTKQADANMHTTSISSDKQVVTPFLELHAYGAAQEEVGVEIKILATEEYVNEELVVGDEINNDDDFIFVNFKWKEEYERCWLSN